MNSETYKKLIYLPYFTKQTVRNLSDSKDTTVDSNISFYLKNKKIIQLKNGVYTTHRYYIEHKNELRYLEYIAFILLDNSYLSTEYILRQYDVISESTYGYTSVTLKHGVEYVNDLARFNYRNIREELFLGYEEKYYKEYKYLVATKAKALFDYLYFKSALLPKFSKTLNLVDDLRLNLDSFDGKDLDELREYSRIANKTKLSNIINNIIHNASTN